MEIACEDMFNLAKEHYKQGDTFMMLKNKIYPLLNPEFKPADDVCNDIIKTIHEAYHLNGIQHCCDK